jgi:hypothetical protein
MSDKQKQIILTETQFQTHPQVLQALKDMNQLTGKNITISELQEYFHDQLAPSLTLDTIVSNQNIKAIAKLSGMPIDEVLRLFGVTIEVKQVKKRSQREIKQGTSRYYTQTLSRLFDHFSATTSYQEDHDELSLVLSEIKIKLDQLTLLELEMKGHCFLPF